MKGRKYYVRMRTSIPDIYESHFTDPSFPRAIFLRIVRKLFGRPENSFLNFPVKSRLNVQKAREEDWKVIKHALLENSRNLSSTISYWVRASDGNPKSRSA